MSAPSPLCSKQQWTSFFREFGKNPYRNQKVLVSNLGLTAFVKHLVKPVKQVLQSALRKQTNKKQLKGRDLSGLVHFCPLAQEKPSDAPCLFIENICLTGYIRGQKSTSSGVPVHVSAGPLPMAMQALLVTLIELFLNYKTSAGRGEPGTWVAGQTGKSK
jgi:hypothetical protein